MPKFPRIHMDTAPPLDESTLTTPRDENAVATPREDASPPTAAEDTKKGNADTLFQVDKMKFLRMMQAMIRSQPGRYVGFSAIREFGSMVGQDTYVDAEKWWNEMKKLLD